MKNNFVVIIESLHLDDNGQQSNVSVTKFKSNLICFVLVFFFLSFRLFFRKFTEMGECLMGDGDGFCSMQRAKT